MARRAFFILAAFALGACVGDSNPSNDAGGGDVNVTDAGPDVSSSDAPAGPCVFGTSHFDDGCKFGP